MIIVSNSWRERSCDHMTEPIIVTKGLCKYYGKKAMIKAVDGIDLEVMEGETFGLLGPNGAGKTTTIRMLNCIISPTSGSATVAGYDIITQKDRVKRETGLLAETPGLYEKLSAYEFLEFIGALYDVPGELLPNRIDELLKLFGLSQRADQLLEGYSRGMKQKVLIASSLIHDPKILFLDEPTSSLDPKTGHMVKELIRDLASEAGKTVFISSHVLSVVEELCDRIAIINQGRLVAVGRIRDILESTGTETLESAFIEITGGVEEKELLAWREQRSETI